MECDLSSFDSVRNFAKLYLNTEERLDILICNAGVGYSTTKMTENGFDCVIQSNYLSHFLLTNLLLEKLKQSKPSRILNISSDLHNIVKTIDWSDAFTQTKQKGLMGSYPYSKLFQILSTYKLKQDLFGKNQLN
jgi:NAD(P)-dependent dehydrogenase (short-subunit alcohol dehydrogenase family)